MTQEQKKEQTTLQRRRVAIGGELETMKGVFGFYGNLVGENVIVEQSLALYIKALQNDLHNIDAIDITTQKTLELFQDLQSVVYDYTKHFNNDHRNILVNSIAICVDIVKRNQL